MSPFCLICDNHPSFDKSPAIWARSSIRYRPASCRKEANTSTHFCAALLFKALGRLCYCAAKKCRSDVAINCKM